MLWLKCYSGSACVSDCWGLGFEVGMLNFFELKYQLFESRYLED